MVNFACSYKAGSAPKLSGWKKTFACGWELFIMVSSLSAAPALSASVGSSGVLGIRRAPGFFFSRILHISVTGGSFFIRRGIFYLYPLLLLVP